uniref:myosin-2 isoform X2 n=1 Tax=Anopheles coluzzii TaxID=1518534 RepID=UPI0020FF81C1|nr:myosin-2 isoform X2 [Anopheles coluzzii]
MAEVPSPKMEESFWRGVVLRWVERSGLNPGQDYIDLAACYDSFRSKLKGAYELQEATVAEFMRAKFPRFELRLGPGGEIPESEYVYVFSLMLYFSCIKHPVPYFQNIGKEFDEPFQYSMKAFLHSFVSEGSKEMRIDRAFLERAFGNAARSAPACRADAGSSATLCQSAVQMITSTPNGKREMKKPSPVTPKSVALEWKVKNLSELLVTARAENTSQERQIEQLLQSVQELQEEKRRNLAKISALELKEACVCMSDAVDYLAHPLGRATEQLQKQLESKNRSIEALEEELSRAKETASTEMERYRAMKKQYATLEEDNQLMKLTAEALREELAAKDGANQNLAEAVNDLRRFIRENHLTNGQPMEPLESSFEFLDRSFKNVTPGNDSLCNDAETLAATVVDVKLKEKEHENECLNRKVQELEQRWEEQCKAHAQELARMQTEAQRLAQTLEACEQAKAQLEKHLEREKATTNELNAWKVQLNQQLADAKVLMDKKVAEQQQSLGRALEQAKAELVDQLLKYQTIMELVENEKKQLVKQREEIKASMSAENAELRRSLEAIEQNKTQLAASLKMERALVEDLTRRNQELQAQKSQLKEEFETSKASTDAKIAALLQSLDANEQNKAQLADNLEREMAKTRNLTSRNTELDVVKKQLTEELELVKTSMHESNAGLQRSLDALEHTKTQLADNLEQEMAKTADLNRLTEELEAEKKQLMQELEIQKKQLMQELEVAKTSMSENNAELQRSLKAIEQTKLQLADNLKKEIAKTADLYRRTEELEVEKKQLTQELEVAKTSKSENIAELQRSLEAIEQTKLQLANNLEKEIAKTADLNRRTEELEVEKKQLTQELEVAKTSMSENIAELQRSLEAIEQTKLQLADNLEKEIAKTADLNRRTEELEAEKKQLTQELEVAKTSMSENNAELQRSLEAIEQTKLQLADNLEKEIAKTADLNRRTEELEAEKKQLMQELEVAKTSMSESITELQRSLKAIEQTKLQLSENLEKEIAKTADLNRRTEELEVEKKQLMQELEVAKSSESENIAELQRSLKAIEQTKLQLADNLEKEIAKTADLNRRTEELEVEKKQLLQELEVAKTSMSENNAELQRSLKAIEQTKLQFADNLEKEIAKTADLNRRTEELEVEKKQLLQELEVAKTSMSENIAELQRSLEAIEQTKLQFADNLEKEIAKTADLNRRTEELEVEKKQLTQELEVAKSSGSENIAELQRSLKAIEQTKLQLADNLEKEIAKTADLNRRTEELEVEKKQLMQELEVAKTSMSENIAELQRSLKAIEQTKLQLADNLEKEIAKTADLNRRTEVLEVEKKQLTQELDDMKTTNAALRQSLEVLELTKTQITNSLELELVKIGDLKHQLKAMDEAKTLAEKLGDSGRSEMLAKISLLQQNLEEEREKSEEINCQYLAMKRQADDLDAQCTKLMKSLSENRTEVSDLQQQLAGKTAELEQLKLQYETKQSQKAKEEDLDRLALENEKTSLQQEVARLQAAMDEKTDTLRRSLESVQEAKSQLAHDLEKERQRAVGQQAETADKLAVLQQQLDQERQKCEELNRQYLAAKRQAEELTAKCTEQAQKLSDDGGQLPSLQQEIVAKEAQLETLKAQYDKVLAENEQYVTDCEILSVKLYCARKKHTEMEAEWAQERAALKKELHEKLHESRIEHQNTMEKMKNHMVKLHEESKTKLEHDKQGLAAMAEGYRRKIENLESRCTMLQKQLAEMNERNLETRKENQLLQLRLKTIEEHQGSDRKSLMLPSQSSLRSNLQMEDEVGELFDNMYLTELKNGRCTPPDAMHADFDRYSELSRRNSRQPPHLRTNYMALAPDCIPPQDDTGDNISTTFDDSSTGLITRRKVSGITSYKRPGPPTPSKRAGRLSLNGPLMPGPAEVQYRDALRDTNANGAAAQDASAARTGRTKTPGKFKQMMSASSLLSNFQPRDENTSPRRRLSWFNKGKKY